MSEFNSFSASDSSSYDFTSDPQGSIGGASAGGSMAQMQYMIQEEQQRALIQQAIARYVFPARVSLLTHVNRCSITEVAWDKCVGKPDSSLSSREATCIQNVAGTFVDARYEI